MLVWDVWGDRKTRCGDEASWKWIGWPYILILGAKNIRLLHSGRLISAALHCMPPNTLYQWKAQEQTNMLVWDIERGRKKNCGDQASWKWMTGMTIHSNTWCWQYEMAPFRKPNLCRLSLYTPQTPYIIRKFRSQRIYWYVIFGG